MKVEKVMRLQRASLRASPGSSVVINILDKAIFLKNKEGAISVLEIGECIKFLTPSGAQKGND